MTNQIAIDFIKAHEGCKLSAYQDSVGVWTCGWGSTGHDVVKGTAWTQQEADNRLAVDVSKAESDVRRVLGDAVLSTEQMAALISFAYNLGVGALATSSVLLPSIKSGDWLSAAKQFERFDHAGGKEVKGLLLRRMEEAVLFLQGS